MHHIIDGREVDLRSLTPTELSDLIEAAEARRERAVDELESLVGEQVRRSEGSNVFPLFASLRHRRTT